MLRIALVLQFVCWILTVLGGIAVGALFFYGIYVLFAESFINGLTLIGASMLATFLLNLTRAAILATSDTLSRRAVRVMEEALNREKPPPSY
jgi:hypothetical protein